MVDRTAAGLVADPAVVAGYDAVEDVGGNGRFDAAKETDAESELLNARDVESAMSAVFVVAVLVVLESDPFHPIEKTGNVGSFV